MRGTKAFANPSDGKKRLKAALELLDGSATTIAKFNAARALIRGMSPKTDDLLKRCSEHIEQVRKLQAGEVIELAAENLPERTEEEKKRKKYLLLLIKFWKELKSEIKRVRDELDKTQQGQQGSGQAWWNIFTGAKGILGLTTIVAVGAALVLQQTAVQVRVSNVGCEPINLSYVPVPLPGLSLPKNAIASGSEGVVTMPPLDVTVDATSAGSMNVSLLGFVVPFEASGVNITLDGQSLNAKVTSVDLGDRKEHTVVVTCL